MQIKRPMSAALGVSVLASALLVAGCGGGKKGGPTGPSMGAPIISNLRLQPLTPEVSGRPVLYEVTATVSDPDGDLVGGRVEVRLVATGETVGFAIDAPFPGDRLDTALVTDPLPPGRFDLVFTATDAAGHRSNEVSVSIAIAAAELPRGPSAESRPSGAPPATR